ncbi:hypothetical protein [Alysiella crassa]|uniref:Uncharacterized protein n=2 Tax=Alysiella crassa TaxID=153491 RepID=A0A376BN81_9NEIS|nr:hypothetical protein [Alysiella crassa]SSY71075.1 Uncharacterised protein [Alysiella crassa]
MDFNQTARETLTRVQSELAQGQTQISWDILYPIFDRENYLKEMKKSFGWRSHIKSVFFAFLMLIGLSAQGLNKFWAGLASVLFLIWAVWDNQKTRQEMLAREYFVYGIQVNFNKRKAQITWNGVKMRHQVKFHKNEELPSFNLPERPEPSDVRLRDTLQNRLAQKMGVRFVEQT